MEFTYLTGMIISFILGFIYVFFVRKDFTEDMDLNYMVVITLFSWLGVAMSVLGLVVTFINYKSKEG
jgi:hypothetical protein